MFKKLKSNLFMVVSCILIGTLIIPPADVMAADVILESDEASLDEKFSDEEQKQNAINMLNHIVALTEEIQTNSGSKLYMEEIFNSLINNTHPNAVDALTLDEVRSLLNSLEKYRLIDVNRERLEYVLEQDKAQALRDAVPDPITLLSISRTKNPLKIAASLAYMAIDAKTGYDAATADADLKYIEKNLDLDNEAYSVLAESSSDLFAYKVKLVNSNNLNGDLSLTQDLVKDFVKWKNKDNVTSKIQHFESVAKQSSAYKYFGPYWLELAECYYENEDYQKCLSAIDEYESLNIKIYNRDYEYAKVLPKGLVAAREVLPNSSYIKKAEEYCQGIIDNSKSTDWASLYYVAETYMTLYAETEDKEYLQSAYDIVVDNVNNLIEEQLEKNKTYESEVVEKKAVKLTKSQKKEVDAYNKMLKDVRKKELVPVSEPLLLNCRLLFILSDELNVSQAERERVERILHPNGNALFLNPLLDDLYSFDASSEQADSDDIKIEFNGKAIALPAMYVTEDTDIMVSVSSEDADITDWNIKEVKRKKGKSVDTFTAKYESKDATKVKYNGGEKITITITPKGTEDIQPLKFDYEVTKSKRAGFLDNWTWLDHASEWSDDIQFVRINS